MQHTRSFLELEMKYTRNFTTLSSHFGAVTLNSGALLEYMRLSSYKWYGKYRAQYHQLAESATLRSPRAIRAPASTPTIFQIPDSGQFDGSQYPHVKFPTRQAYNKHTATKAAKKKIADPAAEDSDSKDKDMAITDFIETENGTIVSADTARSIRNLARSVLIEMDSHPTMQLPKKWGQVGITERKFFVREMYAKFPILWLCHDDWKVLLVASNAVQTYHSGIKRQTAAASNRTLNPSMSGSHRVTKVKSEHTDDVPNLRYLRK